MNAFEVLWKMLVDHREQFGKIEAHNLGGAYFWDVMYAGTSEVTGKTLIFWRHYGSSANKCTRKDLRWLLKEIYHMTPAEFLAEYTTLREFNRIENMYKTKESEAV